MAEFFTKLSAPRKPLDSSMGVRRWRIYSPWFHYESLQYPQHNGLTERLLVIQTLLADTTQQQYLYLLRSLKPEHHTAKMQESQESENGG